MFLGQYRHNIDSKGRLTVPARYRELLTAEGAYITRGFDHNLIVFPEAAFTTIYDRVSHMSMTDPKTRLLRRLILANAERVEMDRLGRILIPQFLRQAASLEGEAVVVGAGDYFEIWPPDQWVQQMDQLNDEEANVERFSTLDIST
jgi:MraZ protein